MARFRKGSKVEWDWGRGTAAGTITERFTGKVTRTIKGATITRDATTTNPAYLIEQPDGDRVLKSKTEIRSAR